MENFEGLKAELTRLVNRHYEKPEIQAFLAFPMTVARGRVFALHRYHFNKNRRDCWGSIQSGAPIEVKRLIWEHEKEELISDPRFGGDHHTAALQKAMKLTGLTPEEIYSADLIPGCKAAFCAWLHLARDPSWLRAFTSATILEWINSSRIVEGGAGSIRNTRRYTPELQSLLREIPGHDVHNTADDDHADMMEVVLRRYANAPADRGRVFEAARDSLDYERAFKGALADALQRIDE